MSKLINKPSFMVNLHDSDGDVFDSGIFLCHQDSMTKVSEDINGFKAYIGHLQSMIDEIEGNL